MDLCVHGGRALTPEERALEQYVRAKQREAALRREQESATTQLLDRNATRAMQIAVPPPAKRKANEEPEPKPKPREGDREGDGEGDGDGEARGGEQGVAGAGERPASLPSAAALGPEPEKEKELVPEPGPAGAAIARRKPAERASEPSAQPAAQTAETSAEAPVQKYLTRKRVAVARDALDESIFPAQGLLLTQDWNPSHAQDRSRGRELLLPGFDVETGNQTVALKISVPAESTRWALNVVPPEHRDWGEVLLHVNPRRFKRSELVVNSRSDGVWRKATILQLSDLPPLFGSGRELTLELIVQVRAAGFFVFLNRSYLAHLAHRRDITAFPKLLLQLPSTDDNGNPNDATFHRVWWGQLEPSFLRLPADLELSGGAQEEEACSIFIKGLPRKDKEDVEALLWEQFDPFDPVSVNVLSVKGVAYVKVRSAEGVRLAIERLHGTVITGDESDFTLSLTRSND